MLGQKSLKKFRWFLGRNDDIKKSFWNQLTFSRIILIPSKHIWYFQFSLMLMSSVAHEFGHAEFRILNISFDFFKCACLKTTTTNIQNLTQPNQWVTKDKIIWFYYYSLDLRKSIFPFLNRELFELRKIYVVNLKT